MSLASLKAQGGPAPRPKSTVSVTLVTGQHLLDEQKALQDKLIDLLTKAGQVDEDGEPTGPPLKASQRSKPAEVDDIKADIAALVPKLAEHQHQLTVVGSMLDGEWVRWKDNHPAREDHVADEKVAGGFCNSTDLYDTLGLFVAEFDGEPVPPGDWDSWLADRITFADKRALVSEVVALYENRVSRAPKSLNSSSTTTDGSAA